MTKFRRSIATLMIMLMCLFQVSVTQGAMISTNSAIQTQQVQMDRADILNLFSQENLRTQLIHMGVNPDKASERIASMTDAEIIQINDRLKDMPAGEGVGSLLLILFIVFVITDVIGATDIFSFIHPVTR